MMYKTHKAGGALAMLSAYYMMQTKGMVVDSISPFVQLLLMYPAASWASTAPDLDHCIDNVKERTPFNTLVHKVLHLGKMNHRSWQTHSITATGGFCLLLYAITRLLMVIDTQLMGFDLTIINLLLTGIYIGIASHLALDSLTMAGIWLIPGIKIRFVPNIKIFGADSKWDDIVRGILYLFILVMTYLILDKEFNFRG